MAIAALPEQEPVPKSLHDIPGWFYWADQHLFDLLLDAQLETPPGTLVELGAFKGKSAVLIGRHLRPGERFVVCDLFGAPAEDLGNATENDRSYRSLTREAFERNYLAFHDVLPEIIHDVSASIVEHVDPGSARFVHVDASHLYHHVRGDIESARHMLRRDGIVVFDDYRSEHTPGVAAAVWQAVAQDGLVPFAHTPNKLYATFGDPTEYLLTIEAWAARSAGFSAIEEHVGPARMLRVKHQPAAKAASAAPAVVLSDVAKDVKQTKAAVQRLERSLGVGSGSRQAAATLLEDLLPPALLRVARRAARRRS